jgi:hypothetical protein
MKPSLKALTKLSRNCLLLLTLANTALAAEGQDGKFFLSSMSALRINPIGVFETLQIGYQKPLTLGSSESPLFKDTYVKLAFAPSLSPAFGRWGALAEVMPLSILRLSVLGEYVTHFGTFGTLQSFQNPSADFSDTQLKALRNSSDTAQLNYATTGTAVTFGALLQGKTGEIVARSNYRAIHQDTRLTRPGDTVYYDILNDILAPQKGWIHLLDTDVLRQDGDWTYGVRHSLVATSYNGMAAPENTPTHRVGALISRKLALSEDSKLSSQSAFLLVQWWVKHRFRTGADTSAALPLIALGYSFAMDLR